MSDNKTIPVTVADAKQLDDAVKAGALEIVVRGTITASRSITLPPGGSLSGGELVFLAKGVQLTRDNSVRDITIRTRPEEVAVYNDTSIPDAGTLRFDEVVTTGQVYIRAEFDTRSVRVETNGLHVAHADLRGRAEQPYCQPDPELFGVYALQGAVTLWNRQPDPSSSFTASLRGVSACTGETPIRGSGVMVAGLGGRDGSRMGGEFRADVIETGAIVTDGGIAAGASDEISAGVMVSSGATVDRVVNTGAIATRGQNDFPIDNWGRVRKWVSKAPLTSTGASGIGFINFGDITTLDVQALIHTTGAGARGFNLYGGSLEEASFHSIRTEGDGAVGIQTSKPMGSVTVVHDIETTGGVASSLVLGVQMQLAAGAVSIKPGATLDALTVRGSLRSHGDHVVTLEIDEGAHVGALRVAGEIAALGVGSTGIRINGDVDVRELEN